MINLAIIFIAFYLMGALLVGVTATLSLLSVHVVILPLLFRYSKSFRRRFIFLNAVHWPLNTDFTEPSLSGIEGARNLYIEHQSKVSNQHVKIGVWHVLPSRSLKRLQEKLDECTDEVERCTNFDKELADSGRPVIMYCHGNSNNRAAGHRIKLYRVLQELDAHIIAFDYRGYGDSSDVRPTEPGVVEDSLIVYDWLLSTIGKSKNPPRVFVWGHSLGTGVSAHLLGNLRELSAEHLQRATSLPLPAGLILEAPFNNIRDEVSHHPLSKLVRWLPYYDAAFVRPFSGCADYEFKSDQHLTRVDSLPLLILHAKDDMVVPYELGVKLLEAVSAARARSREAAPVTLHSFERSLRLGHKWICKADVLPRVLGTFMTHSVEADTSCSSSGSVL